MYLINRQGKIKLDTVTRQVSSVSAHVQVSTDVCNENVFIGRGDALFGELIFYYEGSEVSDQLTFKVWAGDACSLAGVSPLVNYTVAAFDTFMDVSAIEMWNFLYSGLSSQPVKNLWVALWEHVPGAIEANPYGCLLYTSDAADERSSVDLGGRRIIKKKISSTKWLSCARTGISPPCAT